MVAPPGRLLGVARKPRETLTNDAGVAPPHTLKKEASSPLPCKAKSTWLYSNRNGPGKDGMVATWPVGLGSAKPVESWEISAAPSAATELPEVGSGKRSRLVPSV